MTYKKTSTALIISALFSTTAALAHENKDSECDVALNYDISLTSDSLVVSDNGKEKYRIEDNKLFVLGKKIPLDSRQSQLLNKYSDEMSDQVPEVIELVNDAVEMASGAVSIALTPLLGDTAGAKMDDMMKGIEARVAEVAYQNGDEYYLGATESTLENVFDEEFEKEIETAVQSSIGSIMMAVGGQLMSSEGGSFEEKIASFEKKMEGIGSQIESQVEVQSANFEQKAELMCENFKSLATLEEQVRNEIPELADFVVAVNESEYKNLK
ncbi:DUF2884 family protein [Parashewanella spongiae]|uniref:DUF2884 family protein n=1 Tax=Parashewanella spongiae TaxID=342950 RepID=A0A3A6UCG5_9GAMM|nr:YggN family protein [Parashewanella spongiae]MCL1078287.1 YggN family protein [Parashewanella spongiae]RJY15012.1 DUF2884 family protein [Parashewanella spongiae]